ncbi:uncharacterized protein LOC103569989 [Microplitis demolitor]|uniref:uncharacterized protein LOC103569989 n=1 Tax=Microplitis demolitor TaxID=69319 RepID=UPI0004CD8D5F|nr:uncharacterized protein LOC103569989 [Microplitis demolitor]
MENETAYKESAEISKSLLISIPENLIIGILIFVLFVLPIFAFSTYSAFLKLAKQHAGRYPIFPCFVILLNALFMGLFMGVSFRTIISYLKGDYEYAVIFDLDMYLFLIFGLFVVTEKDLKYTPVHKIFLPVIGGMLVQIILALFFVVAYFIQE